MCGTSVLDKDGISAALVAAEMAAYLEDRGISLRQQLTNIYTKYAFLSSFFAEQPKIINSKNNFIH